MAADKEKAEKKGAERRSHAKELRKQVHGKESEKIQARKDFFDEGARLRHEASERYIG